MAGKSRAGWTLLALLALLALGACYDKNEHSPTAPETVNALSLSAGASSLPADGFSRLELVARIDRNADADRRSVVFTTSAGTLVGSTANPPRSLTVIADTNGEARAFLQSSSLVETAVVQASVANVASVVKTLEIAFQPISSTELLRIGTSAGGAPADGATVIQVYADVAASTPAPQRTVTFTTSAGTLLNSTAIASDNNRATVDLRSPADISEARVTASANGATAQTRVTFFRALPNKILVSTDKIQLKATLDDSLTVTATLLRNVGQVTNNTVVTYTVLDAATRANLDFLVRGVTPSASDQSQATITAGATTFRGNAIIRAATEGGVAGEVTIVVVDGP